MTDGVEDVWARLRAPVLIAGEHLSEEEAGDGEIFGDFGEHLFILFGYDAEVSEVRSSSGEGDGIAYRLKRREEDGGAHFGMAGEEESGEDPGTLGPRGSEGKQCRWALW